MGSRRWNRSRGEARSRPRARACRVVVLPTVRAGAIRLSYEEMRSDAAGGVSMEAGGEPGRPLVLVAGGMMDMDQWEEQRALGGARRLIRFDQRGTGESDGPAAGYTIEEMAADTLALGEALGATPCVLFGNSLGGLVALEAALQAFEAPGAPYGAQVRGLILAATSAGVSGTPTPAAAQTAMFQAASLPLEEAARALQPLLFETDLPRRQPRLLERAVAKRRAHTAPLIATMGPLQSAAAYDPLPRLGGLTCPTLILHGEADRLVPVENARLLGDRIAGARVVTVAGAGQALVLEAAARVNAEVAAFLVGL